MRYRTPVPLKSDCKCGYAKHNTEDCRQYECSKYAIREINCAQAELQHDIASATEGYLERIQSILKSKEELKQ